MFFRAQNLGPLRDAEIDLSKDLIVLAGPNNSGKTYLAWSVYGLHHFHANLESFGAKWAVRLMATPERRIDVNTLFADDGPSVLETLADQCRAQLSHCFAAEAARFTTTELSVRLDRISISSGYTSSTMLDRNRALVLIMDGAGQIHLLLSERIYIGDLDSQLRNDRFATTDWQPATSALVKALSDEQQQTFSRHLSNKLARLIPRALFPECVLFPAERIAVNIFAKELALKRSELIDEMVDADLEDQPDKPLELIRRKAGRYPWPIRDSLKVANDLANLSKDRSAFSDLADELEQAILGGAVNLSDQGELLFSPDGVPETRLAIHLTASVVKSLTSLVFYFRHLAQKGDFLIIDEPELNLHPDNQRKIARILAKAVRRGFKVMISTHSDYVLRELNHLIMLNKLPAEEARELGYDPEFALDPAKVGVYLVDDHRAESIPIEDAGFSIKTIDAVVNQLNIDEQRLYARLAD